MVCELKNVITDIRHSIKTGNGLKQKLLSWASIKRPIYTTPLTASNHHLFMSVIILYIYSHVNAFVQFCANFLFRMPAATIYLQKRCFDLKNIEWHPKVHHA